MKSLWISGNSKGKLSGPYNFDIIESCLSTGNLCRRKKRNFMPRNEILSWQNFLYAEKGKSRLSTKVTRARLLETQKSFQKAFLQCLLWLDTVVIVFNKTLSGLLYSHIFLTLPSGLVFILLCCLFNPSQCCLQATSGKSLANKCPSEYISHFISPTFISGRRMGTETQGLMGKYIIISKNLSPQKIIITPDNVIATGPHHTSASVYFCVVYLPQWLFFAVLPECSMGTWPYGHSCTIRHLHSLRHPIFSPWIKINRPLRFHTCWQASTTRPCEMYLPRRNNNLSQLIFK